MMTSKASKVIRLLLVVALGLVCVTPASPPARAARQSPAWWDPDRVGQGHDWHYRVWVTVTAAGAITRPYIVQHELDFPALLQALGVTGTFDPASIRVIWPGGTPVSLPYKWADADADGRGILSWQLDDDGSPGTPFTLAAGQRADYAVYFDILENCGPKPTVTPALHTLPDVAVYADNNGWWIPAGQLTQIANALAANLTTVRSVSVFRQNAADHAAIRDIGLWRALTTASPIS